MGRHNKGCIHTYQCKRIELSYLLKSNIIQKGKVVKTTISWNDNCRINITTNWTDTERYLLLEYTHTDYEGNKTALSYRVNIIALTSNLGKGQVLFMICPVSGRYCRKLFMAYDSPYFKSIKAYHTRIYYIGQLSSKLNRANDVYWYLINSIECRLPQRNQNQYKGRATKRTINQKKLSQKLALLDLQRWNDVPVRLKGVSTGIY